ncbi:MAG: M28 family peptidase [Bacteroidota bacterium]
MKFKIGILLIISLQMPACAQKMIPEIKVDEVSSHIRYLASDSLEGRYPGTLGDSLSLNYIRNEFKKSGLRGFRQDYLQPFTFLSGISPSDENTLIFDDFHFVQGKDFYPMSFSSEGSLEANLVFCGYGFNFKTEKISHNDYDTVEAEGKWALILRGSPEDHEDYLERSSDRDKALLAQEMGARGVLLVSGPEFLPLDELDTSIEREPEIDIPVIQVTRLLANKLLKHSGYTIENLEKESKKTLPAKISSPNKLKADLKLKKVYTPTANVVAYLMGNGKDNKWIVVGAHHDHLGMGGPVNSSRTPDTFAVHNGADDNASGVAAMLELAEFFSFNKDKVGVNIIFVSFGAEEKGLVGSRYFVENPPVELDEISLMINMDMLGRMNKDSTLQVGGVGTFHGSKDILDQINKDYKLRLSFSEAGYGPSDHASFYAENIPVLFFSTGAHSDYHTPFDDPDSLNYEGLVTGTRFIAEAVSQISKSESPVIFQEAGPKQRSSRNFRNMVTLGIMPDVSGSEEDGMKVLAVSDGKPADLGGMKKGDRITAIEGENIDNVYDYMYRLKQLKTGQQIVVTIIRGNETIDLLIQL